MSDDSDRQLVQAAVAKQLISAEEAEQTLGAARLQGKPVSSVLIERGLMAQRTVSAIAATLGSDPGLAPVRPNAGIADIPAMVGDYDIIEKLGQGGMGAVYRAKQRSLGREVALKVLAPGYATSPQAMERFEREARTAAAVSHPNVVTVFAAGHDGARLFLAMELLRAGDAQQLAEKEGGRLSERRALEVIRDCARGLGAIERAALVHRDIKPSNIFLADDGSAKLADLGLARLAAGDDRMTQTGMIVGTPQFMSPEQADGLAALDVRSDIYSLGASLYQLATGRAPFSGASVLAVVNKVINESAPDPRVAVPSLSAATAELVLRTMSKEPAKRPRTSVELVEELEACLAQLGKAPPGRAATAAATPPPRALPEGPAPAGRGPSPVIAVVVAGAVALLLVGGLVARQKKLAREQAAALAARTATESKPETPVLVAGPATPATEATSATEAASATEATAPATESRPATGTPATETPATETPAITTEPAPATEPKPATEPRPATEPKPDPGPAADFKEPMKVGKRFVAFQSLALPRVGGRFSSGDPATRVVVDPIGAAAWGVLLDEAGSRGPRRLTWTIEPRPPASGRYSVQVGVRAAPPAGRPRDLAEVHRGAIWVDLAVEARRVDVRLYAFGLGKSAPDELAKASLDGAPGAPLEVSLALEPTGWSAELSVAERVVLEHEAPFPLRKERETTSFSWAAVHNVTTDGQATLRFADEALEGGPSAQSGAPGRPGRPGLRPGRRRPR